MSVWNSHCVVKFGVLADVNHLTCTMFTILQFYHLACTIFAILPFYQLPFHHLPFFHSTILLEQFLNHFYHSGCTIKTKAVFFPVTPAVNNGHTVGREDIVQVSVWNSVVPTKPSNPDFTKTCSMRPASATPAPSSRMCMRKSAFRGRSRYTAHLVEHIKHGVHVKLRRDHKDLHSSEGVSQKNPHFPAFHRQLPDTVQVLPSTKGSEQYGPDSKREQHEESLATEA